MKYRLAGATYRVIAEKLTQEKAQAYADAKGISFDRAMKKIQPVSIGTAWGDVTAEMEDLRRETEVPSWRPDGVGECAPRSAVLEGVVAIRQG